jgi:YD repeat-containing protein
MMHALGKLSDALVCRISRALKIASKVISTRAQAGAIRWALVFLATTLIVTSAFATNYLVFPSQGTWTLGTGLESKSASTNGSNPITNSEVQFSARKSPAGNFISNGVLCLCLKRVDGTCAFTNLAAPYTVGTSTVTFPPLTLSFIGERTYFVQRSDNNQTTCTSLDPLFKSGEMIVRGDIAPPAVTTLTATQSGLGVSGTVQILSPDAALLAPKLHFARGSSAGPYNCTKALALSQSLQSWSVDKLTGEDANTATGATCATVFSGTGTQTIWVKVEAFNTAGLQAVVGGPTNPTSAIVNWTPSISSVSPLAGATGQPATVTVTGANLPSTLVMDIDGQSPGCTRQSVSPTQATFYCPLSLVGSRLLSVKTDTNANGGTVINQQTFLVNLTGGFGAITVGSVTPDTARLDVPVTFNVTGTGLTAGMGFAVDDCELVTEVAGGTATSRSWTCTPRAPGIKAVHVKTAPGGTEISGSFRVRVEHPQRLGDPAARGNPSVGGVTLFNGNFFTQSVDLAVPGKGLSFALTRSYNSYDWQYETDHGGVPADRPWRFNIEMRIGYVPNTANKRLYVAREDGSGESYFLSGSTWYPIDLGNFSTIRVNGDNTYTVQTRGQLSYTYEAPTGLGRLLRVNDRDGNQLTYTYGANGRVTQITDASGRAYTVSYDPFNRLSRVTDFTGRYVEYTYVDTISGKIATFRDVRGGLTRYTYSLGTNNLQTVIDPRGNTALTLSYTVTVTGTVAVKALTLAVGRATGGRTCNGIVNTTVFTYCFTYTQLPSSAGFRTVVDGPENSAISSVDFDNAGRAAAITDGQGNRRTTAYANIAESTNYAKSALPTVRKSPLGVAGSYQTEIGYNLTHGLAESVKNPELETSTTGWNIDPVNNLFTPATVTTALNNTSGLGYTPTGRPTRITAAQQFAQGGANGPSTRLNWTGGLLTSVTDPLNRAITLTRDTHGNLTETSDPRNPLWKTIRAYDALGRVITVTDARGGITRYTYDAAGNVLTTTQELPGLPSIVNTHTYDANGNLATHLDPRGTLTTYTYDIGNRLTSISRVVSGVSTTRTLGYDNASRVTSVTNENNNTSTRIFDAAGRVSTEALPLSRTTQYAYDADSRLKTVTDPEGRTTTYEYDKVGRVTSVTNTLGLTQRYQYNPEGRLAAFTDARGNTTRYGYDRNGNLTTVTDANNVISTAAYDDANRMTSRTDPRGKTTRYEYDFAGNLTAEIDPINNRWDYTYDENNNLTSVRNPDTRLINHLYDAQNRRTRTTYSNATQVNYTYDANGNLATMVDSVGTTSYQYDEANRLKQFTDPFGNIVSYTFDKAGNRKTMTYPGARVVTYGLSASELFDGLICTVGDGCQGMV